MCFQNVCVHNQICKCVDKSLNAFIRMDEDVMDDKYFASRAGNTNESSVTTLCGLAFSEGKQKRHFSFKNPRLYFP